jgi:hypothetical protein
MFGNTIEYLWQTSKNHLLHCTMPVCIFNLLARSSCQPLLSQLLQQTTPLYTGPCCLSCCPCCHLQPLHPPMPALTHSCPSLSPLSIAILPLSRRPLRRRRCRPSQLCCRLAAAITVSHCNRAAGRPRLLLHTRRPRCMLSHARCCHCMLLHARRIRCLLMHARWLPAVHCNCAPGCRRLLPHTRTLLTAAPTPLLLPTAARTPHPPLLPSPLPPPPLLVPCALIAKKKVSINWCD